MAKKKKVNVNSSGSSSAKGSVVSIAVKVNGTVIPDSYQIFSIEVDKTVNQIPIARIVIIDGNAATGKFDASSSSTFVPGGEIIVEAGYDKVKQIFKGIITQQSIKIDRETGSTLELECRDKAIKMSVGRNSSTYSNQKDSEIITSLIANYNLIASVAATVTTWPSQVQYYVTDWDFILNRAEANGLIVTASDGKITAAAPDSTINSVFTIIYGESLIEFNADLNSVNQLESVKASAWDYKNQMVQSGEALNDVAGPGNLSSKKLAEVIGLSEFNLQTAAALEPADLVNWSKAQLVKSAYSKIRGKVKTLGTSTVSPANYITLGGVGDRFNGNHFVSGVNHTLREGNWHTEISFGLKPEWFTGEKAVMAPTAAGLLPGARGLFHGIVKKIYDDPETQYRILVDIPLMNNNNEGIWARLSNFYATNGAGAFFLPEIDDEVIIGFLNEDPRFPVVLGSLYSNSKQKPFAGLEPERDNKLKAIVSKSGISVQFDDEDKILTLTTPGNNSIILSDDESYIELKDQHSNCIKLSAEGIIIASEKDIAISAKGNVNITATSKISAIAQADLDLEGMNVTAIAKQAFTAKGNATAELAASGQTTVKGAMVMIN